MCCGSWGRKELDMTSWLNNSTYIKGKESSLKSIFLQEKKILLQATRPLPTMQPAMVFLHLFLTFCFPGILLPTSDYHVKIWEVSRLASRGFLPTVYKHHKI